MDGGGNDMKATFEGKDQNWTDQQTIYWFSVEVEHVDREGRLDFDEEGLYGVVEGRNPGIVDDRGEPLEVMYFQDEIELLLKNAVTDQMRAE